MLKAVSAAIGIGAGFVAGTIYGKCCNIDRTPIKPGIPLFGIFSAADSISNLPIPLEPDKSAPRIFQVMRFGFPKLFQNLVVWIFKAVKCPVEKKTYFLSLNLVKLYEL